MESIVNHRVRAKEIMRELHTKGLVKPPAEPLQVPVLTTSNFPDPTLNRIMKHDPLFHFDKRPEKKWGWWLKVASAEKYAKRFKEEGHKFFLYVDSDDSFLWRSFSEEDCEELLKGKDICFQASRSGYPKFRHLTRASRELFNNPGPCAGCYLARTKDFQAYINIIKPLNYLKTRCTRRKRNGFFDDQAAWRTLAVIAPDKIRLDTPASILTKIIPTKDTWANLPGD